MDFSTGTMKGAPLEERAAAIRVLAMHLVVAMGMIWAAYCLAGAFLPATTGGPGGWPAAIRLGLGLGVSSALIVAGAGLLWHPTFDQLAYLDLRNEPLLRSIYAFRYATSSHPRCIELHQQLNRVLQAPAPHRHGRQAIAAARELLDHPKMQGRPRFVTRCSYFDCHRLELLDAHQRGTR